MKGTWLYVIVGLLSLSLVCFQAAKAWGDPLLSQQTSLSSQVRSALQDSMRQMTMLEELSYGLSLKLEELESLRERDKEELLTLSRHLDDTMNSLWESSYALEGLNLSLLRERDRNRRLMKWLIAGSTLFLINLLGKAVISMLHRKGVKVPFGLALWV